MNVEVMIYVYIAICVSMILYNIIYVFILRHREKSLESNSEKFERVICDQLEKIRNGKDVSEHHKKMLCKKLDRLSGITAFDKALEKLYEQDREIVEIYLFEIFSVFEYLTHSYISKDEIKVAYFPYILHKYNILSAYESESLVEILFELLRSVNVYCRENTIKAIYGMKRPDIAVQALKILDKNLSFHHPKLICDGLICYEGDKNELGNRLLECFEEFSIPMQVNILNFFRFGNVRCDDKMLEILNDETRDNELRFSAIRYFEKFPSDKAVSFLHNLAENKEGRIWEYQAIATSALKSYPCNVTFRILVSNLSSSQWHVRQNSAVSCQKLGYTYQDLLAVFDGDDRYAREIMRYYLDRQREDKAVKVR